jgi:hypothetical protein
MIAVKQQNTVPTVFPLPHRPTVMVPQTSLVRVTSNKSSWEEGGLRGRTPKAVYGTNNQKRIKQHSRFQPQSTQSRKITLNLYVALPLVDSLPRRRLHHCHQDLLILLALLLLPFLQVGRPERPWKAEGTMYATRRRKPPGSAQRF